METENRPEIVIACQLPPDGQAKRIAQVREALFSRVLSTAELMDGYAYQLPGEDDVLQDLAEFVRFERQCCPFLTFELVFDSEQGPITLTLRGPDGTKTFLRSGFGLPYRDLGDV